MCRITACAFLVAALVAFSGCGGTKSGESVAASAEIRELYASRCAPCHGATGEPSSLAKGSHDFGDPAWQRQIEREEIVEVIRDGRGLMPAWREVLDLDEIEALAVHVVSF